MNQPTTLAKTQAQKRAAMSPAEREALALAFKDKSNNYTQSKVPSKVIGCAVGAMRTAL